MRTILAISIVVLLLGFSASAQSQPNDSCEAHSNDALPKYRIAQRHDLKEGLEIVVSLGPENVSQDHLVAIGCKLGRKFRAQPFLMVWFLDKHTIAKVWQFQTDSSSRETNLALRGSYTFDREKNSQSMTWFDQRPSDIYHKVKVDLGQAPAKP